MTYRPPRPPQALIRRLAGPAVLAAALAATFAAGPASGAVLASATEEPQAESTDMSGMDMGGDSSDGAGASASPSVTAGASSGSSAGGSDMSGMDMGDMGSGSMGSSPRQGHEWSHPEQVAGASVVRIDTAADVSVAVHTLHLHRFTFSLQDDESTTTGFVVNPQGAVVTSSTALKDGDAQAERYAIAAVNEGFTRSGILPKLDDPYKKTHVPADRRFMDGPGVDMEERLQSCYDWHDAESHCAVFVRQQIKVTPMSAAAVEKGGQVATKPWSDDLVAVVTTSGKNTPLTLTFAPAAAKSPYWMVGTVDGQPVTVTGTTTGDPAKPLSADDLKSLWKKFGAAGAGSPLVSRTGSVIGMLSRDDDGFSIVPADHLARDSGKSGITLASGTLDTRFRDGMMFLEASEFRSAHAQLAPVVTATGGQVIPSLLDEQAESKQNTAADRSDEAEASSDLAGGDSWFGGNLWLLVGGAVAVVLLLLLVGLIVWRVRSRRSVSAPAAAVDPAAAHAVGPGRQAWYDAPDPAEAQPVGAQPIHGQPVESQPVEDGSVETQAVGVGPAEAEPVDAEPADAEPADVEQVEAVDDEVEHADAHSGTRLIPGYAPDPTPVPVPSSGATQLIGNGTGNGTGNGAAHGAVHTTILATPKLEDLEDRPQVLPADTPAADSVPAGVTPGSAFCRQCGVQLSPGDRFCYSCGTPAR